MRNNILLGDVHGEWGVIFEKLNSGVIDGCDVYSVGDFGLGFPPYTEERKTLFKLNKRLEKHDARLFIIRGNHDDPDYWLVTDNLKEFNTTHSNIELIPDYTTKIINDKRVLFVGGATSVDRVYRQEEELKGGCETWWSGEVLNPPPEDLTHHDIIIAHTMPSFFNYGTDKNHLKWWLAQDDELHDDLVAERKLMDVVFHQVKPDYFYSGHFHNSNTNEAYGCRYRCLDIDEMLEF